MAARSIEVRGRTKDEAIREALDELGLGRDDVEIEVLEEGRAGVFGVGSQDARVRVTVIDPYATDADEEEFEEEGQPVGLMNANVGRELDVEEEIEEAEEELEDSGQPAFPERDAEVARDALEQILDLLDFPNVVTIANIDRTSDVTSVRLDVAAEDVGLLIGRAGDSLACLQFLLNACLARQLGHRTRVVVDVEHYRDRREQSLRGVALRTADRVRRERRPITLEPMPANERRIIHLALQESPYVMTESTGEGSDRRVVVLPRGGQPRRPSPGPRDG